MKLAMPDTVNPFDNWSVKVRSSKCFGDDLQGFDKIRKINLIVGKKQLRKVDVIRTANVRHQCVAIVSEKRQSCHLHRTITGN